MGCFCDALSRGQRYHAARFSRWRTITVFCSLCVYIIITMFCSCHSDHDRLFVDQVNWKEPLILSLDFDK